jgi:hypothetical protein
MQADNSDREDKIKVVPKSVSVGAISGWVKVFFIFASLFGLVCGGGITFVMYVGVMGPATYIYPPGQTPQRFLTVAQEVGGLQPGEDVDFFYSVGFIDVKEGFTYVSDRKVVMYDPEGEPPLVTIDYGDVQGLEFERDESFLVDSMITIETDDSYISIPLSSEMDRDVDVYEAIRARVQEAD